MADRPRKNSLSANKGKSEMNNEQILNIKNIFVLVNIPINELTEHREYDETTIFTVKTEVKKLLFSADALLADPNFCGCVLV